jgi:16S rRNA (guanine527-N7)-methyltransferase
MFHVKHAAAPPAPQAAETAFGDRLGIARAYADFLAGPGVERGLLGPREVERLWDRHLLNSAAVSELIAADARVVDIGSGAGLPGIPLAIARPDLVVTLVEPMQRRTDFLMETVAMLGVEVDVIRGRAEEATIRTRVAGADVVVSRAVADLEKLARWSLPLLRPGGRMMALKGDRAAEEIADHGAAMAVLGAGGIEVVRCGATYLSQPTTVVVAVRRNGLTPGQRRAAGRSARAPGRRRS